MNMKKHLLRISVALALLAQAQLGFAEVEPVDQTKDVRADGLVSINVVRGMVRIETWDKPAVRVHGTLDEQTREFIFDVDGRETLIEVKIDGDHDSWWSGRTESSNLTIQLPTTSEVGVRGVSTDVEARGLGSDVEIAVVSGDVVLHGGEGRVTVQSVSGDVEIRDSTGRLRIGTVSGDVDTDNTSGEAQYTSVSGSVLVRNGGDDMSVETVSGDIEVDNELVASLAGHSVSGDIDVMSKDTRAGNIEFDSVSGSIRLRLGGGLNARFDIETGSGTIRNRLSDDQPKVSKYAGDESLRFTLGEGEGRVTLSTRSGDISVGGN